MTWWITVWVWIQGALGLTAPVVPRPVPPVAPPVATTRKAAPPHHVPRLRAAATKPSWRPWRVLVTAYTIGPESTGKGPGDPAYGVTASGVPAVPGVTVAAPRWVPFGTRVRIPGFGTWVVQDRGGAIHGNHIDLCVSTVRDAFQWGARRLTVYIQFPPKEDAL